MLAKQFPYANLINNRNLILMHKGPLTQNLLVELGKYLRHQLNLERKSKRIFSIYVELTQNIYKYSAEKISYEGSNGEVGVGLISLENNLGNYILTSGNMVSNEDLARIVETISYVNDLHKVEIINIMMEKRRNANLNSSGAGIGFFEIAKNSGNAIEYNVLKINEMYSFLLLYVLINSGEK